MEYPNSINFIVLQDFQTYREQIHRVYFVYKPKRSRFSPPRRENPDSPQHPQQNHKENSSFPPDWGVRSHNKTILIVGVVTMGANVLERSVSLSGWAGYAMTFGVEAFELHISAGIGLEYTEIPLDRRTNHQSQITIEVRIATLKNETRLHEDRGISLEKATDIATNLLENRPIILPSIIGKRQDTRVAPKSS